MLRLPHRLFVFVALVALVACEPVPRPTVALGAGPVSGAIAVTADDSRLVIAAEDHDELLVVDRESHDVLHRVLVADAPSHLVLLSSGIAAVTTRYGHTVDLVDIDAGERINRFVVGVEPMGLVEVDAGQLAIVLAGEKAVVLVDVDNGRITERFELDFADPRAIAHVGGTLFVTHMTAGELSMIDLDSGTVDRRRMNVENERGPRLHPNLMRSLTVAPDDSALLVAHSQANADTMRAPLIDDNGNDAEGNCGYSGCANRLGANTPSVTTIDPASGTVVVPRRPQEVDSGWLFPPSEFASENAISQPPSLFAPFESRFGSVALNNPVAVAVADGGRGLLVLNLGTQNVLFLRRDLTGEASDVVGVAPVGHGASSLALTRDGTFAYVWNQFDGTVSEIELPSFPERRRGNATEQSNADDDGDAEFREVPDFESTTIAVVEDALAPDVSAGRKLFHSATDSRMAANNAISCATCHPDGRSDNRTWQFTFGPRNTPQLGGGILDTAPFHWPGDVEDVAALDRMTVRAFMGGTGTDARAMANIGAFIDTIRPAPAPSALQPTLDDAQLRGQAIFEDPEVGCTNCHFGNHRTDNRSHDVDTQATSFDITRFQTPVLHGVARSAPYLHDGSAGSLLELVLETVATDRMGHGSELSNQELLDLASFLETL